MLKYDVKFKISSPESEHNLDVGKSNYVTFAVEKIYQSTLKWDIQLMLLFRILVHV